MQRWQQREVGGVGQRDQQRRNEPVPLAERIEQDDERAQDGQKQDERGEESHGPVPEEGGEPHGAGGLHFTDQ